MWCVKLRKRKSLGKWLLGFNIQLVENLNLPSSPALDNFVRCGALFFRINSESMKTKLTCLALVFALSFGACIKYEIPIPPPPTGGTTSTSPNGTMAFGISMDVNGVFSTYNSRFSVDTSDNSFNLIGWGDSACCTNTQLLWSVNKADNSALTTGMYLPPEPPGYGNGNQAGFTVDIYNVWSFANDVGFSAYPDTINVTNITDTTITGTFSGTCSGLIYSSNINSPGQYDSTLTVTNGKFYLRRN